MGSIRKRTDSDNLMIDFRYQGVRYRQQTTLLDNSSNRKILEKDMKKLEAEIELGILDIDKLFPSRITNKRSFTCETTRFNQFAQRWLNEKKIEWKDSYYTQTESILNKYLMPTFSFKNIKDITKADILSYRYSLSEIPGRSGKTHLSASRINHIMSTLRQILNEASERYEVKSVFKNVKTLRIPKTNINPFSLDEIQQILDKVNSRYKNYFTVRIFTGLRSSEINGLKWKHIDFLNKKIFIREAWVNGKSTSTKNDGSYRDVFMSSLVFNALKEHQVIAGKNKYVFTSKSGNPIDNSNLTNRVWYPLLERLNIDRRRPYQTRHTCASLWLSAGESPEWIARQLGHTSTSMLFKTYSQFIPNHTQHDGYAFERLIKAFQEH